MKIIKLIRQIIKEKHFQHYWSLVILLVPLFLIFTPITGNSWDIDCWKRWAMYIHNHGLANVYESDSDYLPLMHYILAIFAWIQGSDVNINLNIHYLKCVVLIFHFLSGYLFGRLIDNTNKGSYYTVLCSMFYLLNIAVLYNTIIWGQVDAILTFFLLTYVYFALQKRPVLSLLFYTLALNFKLQAIIFALILVLLLGPLFMRRPTARMVFSWFSIPILVEMVILLPFLINGQVHSVWNVITESVGKYPFVSPSAYNFWELTLTGQLNRMPDSIQWMGLSYKNWGLIMFFVFGAIALIPLFNMVFIRYNKSRIENTQFNQVVILTCAIIPILFYFFNTQMHERYTHPALIFFILYSVKSKAPIYAVIACSAYFLNLEVILKFVKLPNYDTVIFNRDFIAGLYLLLIIITTVKLYKLALFKSKTVTQREVKSGTF